MNTERTLDPTHKAPTRRTLIPLLVTAVGALLLVYMVYAEGEPGLLPLLLVVGGLAGYAVARTRSRRA